LQRHEPVASDPSDLQSTDANTLHLLRLLLAGEVPIDRELITLMHRKEKTALSTD